MSFEFHRDKTRYFEYQYLNSKTYVLPFIEETRAVTPELKVLEIGCAEGGVLKAFTERGCDCVGVELSASKVENAHRFMREEVESGKVKFICQNIYDVDFESEFRHAFDLIILKDTIEHIPHQENIIDYLKKLLRPEGIVYFGFPPWYTPWGGHQQVCQSKALTILPYFHLLPMPLYKAVLKVFGESEGKIQELIEIKETGISSGRFESIVKQTGYIILKKRFFLVNPIYQYKFGWKPRNQAKWLEKIPVIRDFVSTTVYYTIGVK